MRRCLHVHGTPMAVSCAGSDAVAEMARFGRTTRARSLGADGDQASPPRLRDGAFWLPVGTILGTQHVAQDGLLRMPRAAGPWLGRPKPARRVQRTGSKPRA
jgi:hypothetical protein